MRGAPKPLNYLLEGRHHVNRLPPLGECSRNPPVSVYQLALLWEAAFSFSEFFLRPFQRLAISWWVIYKHTCPHCAECSAVFDQKWHDPRAPPAVFTQSGHQQLFCLFVSLDERSPQRETFCWCKKGETKNSRSPKGTKIDEFQSCSEQ